MTEEIIEQKLEEAIIHTLSSPKKVESEAGSVEQQSITDLIAAAKYLEQKKAAKQGIQFVKINSR
jgi:hypothetical protein